MEGTKTKDIGKVAKILYYDKDSAFTTNIGDVPVAIVNNHNVAFYYWQKHVENASLLRIDAHDDMGDSSVPFVVKPDQNYFRELSICNFTCPAIHYGLISSVCIFNPHEENRLVDFGSVNGHESRLSTKVEEDPSGKKRIEWSNNLYKYKGTIPVYEVLNGEPFVLDVDLDAFCNSSRDTSWIGTRKRIRKTINLLKRLKKPDLITIALSSPDYLPKRKAVRVLTKAFEALKNYILKF